MSKAQVLITGGAGFIGSHVNKCLDNEGYETLVFDNLSTGTASMVTRGRLIEGNLLDPSDLNRAFSENSITAVLHFAGRTNVGESFDRPCDYYQSNVCGTLNLIRAMRDHGCKYLIFSSSAGIFGLPQTAQIGEHHPCNPINPYGRSKWMVEQILRDMDPAEGVKSISLRYFNAAGGDPDGEIKNFRQQEANLIPIILQSIRSGERKVHIFGTDYPTPDGTCVRDYVHVMDLARAHVLALRQLMNTDRSDQFNLGNQQGYSVREVIETIQHVTGHFLEVIEGPRRPGDPPSLIASSVKAERELVWTRTYPDLESMISHAWEAMQV